MFRHIRLITAIGMLAAVATSTGANAGTVTPSALLSQFNAVVFNNFSSTSDVEGRTVVGGNLTGGASFDVNPANAAASSYSALTVYGNATSGGNYNIDNGGDLTIAGNNAVSFALNGGGLAYIGGTNAGAISVTGGAATVTIGSSNSGTVQLSGGGSVHIGGNNTGGLSANGSVGLSVNGNNSAGVTLNGGGSFALNGSNSGTVSLDGGTLRYTGSQTGNLNLNGGATATQVSSLTLTAPVSTLSSFASTFITPLTTLSTQLSGLTANSVASSTNGSIVFNASPNASGVAIFDINSSFLTANSTVTLALNGATSVIINVDVDSCVSNACVFTMPNSLNFNNPTGYASAVLWNFANATGLTFTNEFGGTVLAPLAAVTNDSPIDGTLVASSYSGDGELHSHPYTGTLPGTSGPVLVSTPVAAPEPGSLALIGSGIAGLGYARRRRGRRLHQSGTPARLRLVRIVWSV